MLKIPGRDGISPLFQLCCESGASVECGVVGVTGHGPGVVGAPRRRAPRRRIVSAMRGGGIDHLGYVVICSSFSADGIWVVYVKNIPLK